MDEWAFPENGRSFSERRLVGPGETTVDGRARLDAIVNWLQAVAYADVIDAGLQDLVVWVVRRVKVRVERFPRLGEFIEVKTACSALASRWAERRTSLPGVEAVALWVAMDPKTLRPARIDALADVYGESAGDRRVRTGRTHPEPPEHATQRPWPIRRADLDLAGARQQRRVLAGDRGRGDSMPRWRSRSSTGRRVGSNPRRS